MASYHFTYKNTPYDLWQLYMYHMYGSVAGVANLLLVLTSAVVLVTKWTVLSTGLVVLLCSICALIFVIQPWILYQRAKKIKGDQISLVFDEKGIYATVSSQESFTDWTKIRRVSKKPTMIVLYTSTSHGYVLTKKVMGKDWDGCYQFVLSHMNHK